MASHKKVDREGQKAGIFTRPNEWRDGIINARRLVVVVCGYRETRNLETNDASLLDKEDLT